MEELSIIYEDEHILVVNKPAGLLSIADGYDTSLPHLKPLLASQYGPLWIIHRLDKETSGVIVLAKNAGAHKKLNQQFMDRQVNKRYLCLVSPSPNWTTQEVTAPLRINTGRRHLTRVDEQNGKPAYSLFSLVEKRESVSLIACEITTGYRHQIRAHLYSLGLGILGDPLYRPPQNRYPAQDFPRMMLHAKAIHFSHPANGKITSFEIETPTVFDEILEKFSPTDQDTDV